MKVSVMCDVGSQGEWVWVDSDIGVAIGAKVKETPTGQRLLVDDEGNERTLLPEEEASLRIMHPTSVEGVEDMIKLGDMTEAGLLRNLRLRYRQGSIYTYIGSVLVAMNPYQDFPIYSGQQMKMYRGRKLGELPPHIFAIAESCYFNMTRNQINQCCIISGESGAGKTESTKLILQYLAAISGEISQQQIEKQILESNPVLEAFGNAKTVRNDNSSRFGKYLEIFFNKEGVIVGARVEQYLLEKSRVCHQSPEERSYHIFYCMLAGITHEERKMLRGDCIECEGRNDAQDFSRIRSAMKILAFSEIQFQDVLKLLAAILHLGNVSFEASVQNNLETSDVCKSDHFTIAASLLQASVPFKTHAAHRMSLVDKSSLATSLTHRSFMTNRERVTKPLNAEQAADCRDAFVKAIYNKIFMWIVERINGVIYKKVVGGRRSSFLSIGLLDIFGFENFRTNRSEGRSSGPCVPFSFFLSITVGLFLGWKGSDLTLLTKMNQQHHRDKIFITRKSQHDTDFGIRHFAGVVYYNTNGFLEKNRDAVSFDIVKMIDTSTNGLLRQIFEPNNLTNGLNIPKNTRVIMTPKSSIRVNEQQKQLPTLSGQFRTSLDSLMKALSACQPFFIRCFKPNNEKQSEVFDRELCTRQLRYSGMMDTIRIRRLGYPVRHNFGDFLRRYRVLLKTTVCDPKTKKASACCEAICQAVIKGKDEWKIGRTQIFLRDAHDAALEQLREEELSRVAVVIQRVMLSHKDRKSFLNKRRAAVVLQRNWRAYRERKNQAKSAPIPLSHLLPSFSNQARQGFERLASKVRARETQSHYQKQRVAALTIQTQARSSAVLVPTRRSPFVRGYLARKSWQQKQEIAARLRAETRGPPTSAAAQTEMRAASPYQMEIRSDDDGDDDDQIALELQRRLEEVASQQSEKEPEPLTYLDSADESKASTPRMVVVEERTSEPEDIPEPEVVISKERLAVATPTSMSTTPTPSVDEDEDEFDDESDEFSFYNFSIKYFQDKQSHQHTTQRLRQPLLHHDDEGDALASLTIFWIILRYMGDLPDPKSPDSISQQSSTISRPPPSRRGRRLSHLVGLDQKILRKNKKKHSGLRRASAIPEEPENLTEDEDVLVGEGPTLDRPLTTLEKLHVIIGYALSRQGIRDEIYCQICKQLVNNKNRKSRMQGWTLLSICLGIFPPTDLFMKYLENFLRKAQGGYREYCTERFRRIRANGERKELPCWIELQAANKRQPIDVSVTLTDDSTVSLRLDSASTSAEVCQAVANQIGLRDTYGFSLYISLFDKASKGLPFPLEFCPCGKHVLDAVSQCEQEMRRQGNDEKDTPWKLSIRKELFAPWHNCSEDSVSTDLIYRQVIKGIKSGEYTSEKEDEYVQLAMMHHYIRFGSGHSTDSVQRVVEDCIATRLIENKSMTRWIQLIAGGLSEGLYVNGRQSPERVKGELVDIARQKWPLEFSKFYEVTMMSGPPLPKSRFVVAVNWCGIVFMERKDRSLLEIPYLEVKSVRVVSDSHFSTQSVTLTTLRETFVLKCTEAEDMADLMESNLEGLMRRSVYAVAQHDFSKPDDPSFLVCKRGDLLKVAKGEDYSPNERWIRATNCRTTGSGAVDKSIVQFVPSLKMPTEEMLELLSPGQKKASSTSNFPAEETVAPVSLKDFANEHFRAVGKDSSRHGPSKGVSREKLWAASVEPLKQPLLKTLYMGDYPIKHARSPVGLTNQIFGPPTKHEELQDEIYCQIMKQMTSNGSRLSLERGWQLMWLCTGLFPPSPILRKHAQRFLESRPRDSLSAECVQRIQEICSRESRKLPPYQTEVDAIQQNSTQIFFKVHFPNETDDLFEVTSTTTVKDLRCSIASQLRLTSPDGYGLYVKTPQKVMSLDEQQYFFDNLRQPLEVPKKAKKMKEAIQANLPSLVIFKRKLWFNVTPGKDLVADLTFHFPQELPKYLRGFHNCTKEDMIKLGGLLFRVAVDSDRSQFVMIPRMLSDLVPADQLKIMSPEDWKKHIISSYNKQSGITVQEAKIAFLRAISFWPTFGCAFFEVKQTCESSYPSIVLIAISKKGVSLIDPKSKELLVLHEFNRITEYFSKGNLFQMTIRTLVRGITFVCESPQAYTMEDLVRSYVRMYEGQKQAFRPKNPMFSRGFSKIQPGPF
ncbi:unnamed protein product [Menidia menidia]|uniref:(Atlantic silverside) hypothetical protein n=1 Tax=Menidia menidia TaxID=238744 RepID=A0A8S4AVV2_9TELE|nr:unnamed protein product [Menidia menidia]